MLLSKVFLGVFLSFLILLTVSGNVLVCLAVCTSRRLRCLTNCFIVSLAVTDLLLGLLVLPFSALIQLTGDWPLGPTFCNLYTSLDVMLCTASILTLLAISVDRYLAVTAPLRYASLVLPGRVAVAMAAVWTVALAVSFLPIHMGWNTLDGHVQNRGPSDSPRACQFELNAWYVLVDSSLTFYLPLVAMCWTYYRILGIARAQAKRIISARPSYGGSGGGRGPGQHRSGVLGDGGGPAGAQGHGDASGGDRGLRGVLAALLHPVHHHGLGGADGAAARRLPRGLPRGAVAGLHQLHPQPHPLCRPQPRLPLSLRAAAPVPVVRARLGEGEAPIAYSHRSGSYDSRGDAAVWPHPLHLQGGACGDEYHVTGSERGVSQSYHPAQQWGS